MINNTSSGAKKHCKSTKPESCQTAKMFLSLFFFFFFRRASSKLRDSFRVVYTQNSSILYCMSSAPVHHFVIGLKSHEVVRTGHWRTMASLVMPIFTN